MKEMILNGNHALNGLVWGPAGLVLLFGAGLWLSVCTGFFQFTRARHWLKCTIGAVFTDKTVTARTGRDDKAISQFQSMCTALAATIGTGNIVGVASAIVCGGPGAVFWMWVMALLGMMTAYAERVLGIYYRRRGPSGEWVGGAMYYLADGLGGRLGRILALLYSGLCAAAAFGVGNIAQVNSIAGNMHAAFGLPPQLTGAVLLAAAGPVVLGGVKRVAAVAEKLVPVMALTYILGALVVIGVNYRRVPAALAAICSGAFGARAVGGGVVGYGMKSALVWGFKRGAFSNEAGLGSAVMVSCAANVTEPVQQGMWGIFEVFADTLVMCSLTALAVLSSGLVDLQTGVVTADAAASTLVGAAFGTVFGRFGPVFIAAAVLLFAFSTLLGWSHYGAAAFAYLAGGRLGGGYRLAFVVMIYFSATMSLQHAWDIADTLNGLMMLPNLMGVLALSGLVVNMTQNYIDRTLRGRTVPPMWSAFGQGPKR